jgi:phosphoribosylglycinamide formyltransferase-1
MMKIAIFASGNGSNFEAIVRSAKSGYLKSDIGLLVCDNPEAFVLKRAKKLKIKSVLADRKEFADKAAFEDFILESLKKEKIEAIALAGYMRLLSPEFVKKFKNRIINIHPALLPSFKGVDSIKQVFDYGCKVCGVTVHFVDEKVDHGPIILQAVLDIKKGMSLPELEEEIHKLEHKAYPLALKLFCEKRIKVSGRKVIVNNSK